MKTFRIRKKGGKFIESGRDKLVLAPTTAPQKLENTFFSISTKLKKGKNRPLSVFLMGDRQKHTIHRGPIGGLLELKTSIKHEKAQNGGIKSGISTQNGWQNVFFPGN